VGQIYEEQELTENSDGIYVARVETPTEGWRAYFAQLEFDIGAPTPLRVTTPVRVVPDVLPFADKEAPLDEN
jgi:hypothetical protein